MLLRPVVGLVCWTFFMEGWMYATRLPAMSKYKVKTDSSFTREKLNALIPASVRWKGMDILILFRYHLGLVDFCSSTPLVNH
jgi:hypothetical protein